ncbi:chorismate mutase [Silvibacterium bohemicum]|nr:chorismate mutase [Silvibacterium bohemicum]
MRRRDGVLVLFATLIWGMKTASAATDSIRSLVQTSAQRLQIAEKVALAKWYSGASVEDASREVEVIQKAVKDGTNAGLESAQVERFFKAQIEANKLIQYSLLAEWQRQGQAPEQAGANLVKEIRPQLDEIEKQLIEELKQSAAARSAKTCPSDVAKAVAEYLDSRNLKTDSREGAALDRAMGSACIR